MGAALSDNALYRLTISRWYACGCWGCTASCAGHEWTKDDAVMIKERLANEHCYWSGDIWRDYVFHVANEHPLFGIYLCHPLHPYTKLERFTLEWLRWAATVSWIVLFREKLRMERRESGESLDPHWSDTIVLFFHVTLPILIVQNFLEMIARASGRPGGCLERCCGPALLRIFQWTMIFFWYSMVATMMYWCYVVVTYPGPWNDDGADRMSLKNMVFWTRISLCQSYVTWFIQDMLMPVAAFACPPTFGFRGKWHKEEHEASGEGWLSSSVSSLSSWASSDEEDGCCKSRWR